MLIAILALPYSGASTVITHLISHHSYTKITISPSPPSTSQKSLHFQSSTEFLTYATKFWREDFVTVDLKEGGILAEFGKRPWVRILGVGCGSLARYKRYSTQMIELHRESVSLAGFIDFDDEILYSAGLGKLLSLCTETLENITTLHDLYHQLDHILPILTQSLRPNWDAYFMLLASLASLRSNCMKRRVGAVLVKERRVISTGYNGTPRGVTNCNEGGCDRCNAHGTGFLQVVGQEKEVVGAAMGEGLEECLCLHAEENALLEAGRERVEGAILYCNTCPCLRCTVKIVQCGVKEVIYSLSYSMDDASRRVMSEAGVGLRQIEMPSFPSS